MSEGGLEEPESGIESRGADVLAVRGAIGGTLMGLANLVPGISGGTMLLAAGVYPGFIAAIAELTTLRLRPRSLVLLGSVGGTAALAILMLAGTVKGVVQEHRWAAYSVFIGLTLGGVPLLWRMARPIVPSVYAAAAGAFALMLLMAVSGEGSTRATGSDVPLIFAAGLAASAAMILPGVSGGYLLLLLGQYEPILSAIDQLKLGLLGDNAGGSDLALVLEAMRVVVPVGIGVVIGIVGVSNGIRWLLRRHAKPTLGVLLGLLFGAVVGLWPFQQPVAPRAGDTIKGRVLEAKDLDAVETRDWRLERFAPAPMQMAGALGLILAGFAATLVIARIGAGDSREAEDSS
jgi:putative membrane protein